MSNSQFAVRHRARAGGALNKIGVPVSGDAARANADGVAADLALKVVYRPVEALRPSPRNARTHSDKQIAKICASIRKFRFTQPILIDGEGEILAGHGRLLAAKKLGMGEVPTISLAHLTKADRRAYRIADNRLAELAGWDEDLLKVEFCELGEIDIDLPELTGFDIGDIEKVISDPAPLTKSDPADEVEPLKDDEPAVTRLGDLWLLGPHRLLCADAKQPESYAKLLNGEKAQMVFSDSPYNLPNSGHVTTRRGVREFANAHGEMSKSEFTEFLKLTMQHQRDVSVDGAIHFQCMDFRHAHEMLEAGFSVYSELKNICVWVKPQAGLGSLWRSAHELVFVWKHGGAPHINNIQLGVYGRYRTNVWQYDAVRSAGDADLGGHPTPKSCAMIMDAIKDCSKPNGVILDAFGGSGTTLIAAAKTKRRGYLLELDPLYADVIVRRWQRLFKAKAVHADSGRTFADTAAERLASSLETIGEASNTEEADHVS